MDVHRLAWPLCIRLKLCRTYTTNHLTNTAAAYTDERAAIGIIASVHHDILPRHAHKDHT